MATTIKQFRWNYFINGLSTTYPEITNWILNDDNSSVKVPLPTDSNIVKLAIQAPPGTRFQINNEEFLIGQFGILEFNCAEITINDIYILNNIEATLDQNKTNEVLQAGLNGMNQALANVLNNTNATISVTTPSTATNTNGMIEVSNSTDDIDAIIINEEAANLDIATTFLNDYTDAYNKYLQGVRGIYNFTENSVNNIKNVLIDVLLEENEGGK